MGRSVSPTISGVTSGTFVTGDEAQLGKIRLLLEKLDMELEELRKQVRG
jgi:hypothetical protein